jgi:hypothetical protein
VLFLPNSCDRELLYQHSSSSKPHKLLLAQAADRPRDDAQQALAEPVALKIDNGGGVSPLAWAIFEPDQR